jgi:hypothetical protein
VPIGGTAHGPGVNTRLTPRQGTAYFPALP